jgi:hypothetical protein
MDTMIIGTMIFVFIASTLILVLINNKDRD